LVREAFPNGAVTEVQGAEMDEITNELGGRTPLAISADTIAALASMPAQFERIYRLVPAS
jgi:hypothetical protein